MASWFGMAATQDVSFHPPPVCLPAFCAPQYETFSTIRHENATLDRRPERRTRTLVQTSWISLELSRSTATSGVAQRSERNAARSSSAKNCGSSQAAKWPPFSTSLKVGPSRSTRVLIEVTRTPLKQLRKERNGHQSCRCHDAETACRDASDALDRGREGDGS